MLDSDKKFVIQSVKKGNLGQYILNYGQDLRKSDLQRIIVELDFQLYEATKGTPRAVKHRDNLIEELEERL